MLSFKVSLFILSQKLSKYVSLVCLGRKQNHSMKIFLFWLERCCFFVFFCILKKKTSLKEHQLAWTFLLKWSFRTSAKATEVSISDANAVTKWTFGQLVTIQYLFPDFLSWKLLNYNVQLGKTFGNILTDYVNCIILLSVRTMSQAEVG